MLNPDGNNEGKAVELTWRKGVLRRGGALNTRSPTPDDYNKGKAIEFIQRQRLLSRGGMLNVPPPNKAKWTVRWHDHPEVTATSSDFKFLTANSSDCKQQ